jgi:hypothetical protein
MPIDRSFTLPAGKQRGACDGCGRRVSSTRRVDNTRHSFICCVYVPAVKTSWCGWCGADVANRHFCNGACADEYALDVIEAYCKSTDAAAE